MIWLLINWLILHQHLALRIHCWVYILFALINAWLYANWFHCWLIYIIIWAILRNVIIEPFSCLVLRSVCYYTCIEFKIFFEIVAFWNRILGIQSVSNLGFTLLQIHFHCFTDSFFLLILLFMNFNNRFLLFQLYLIFLNLT